MADETRQYPAPPPSDHLKREDQLLEDVERTQTRATYVSTTTLSPDHQAYLIQRHGTFVLDPIPGFGDADPYNWPQWKVVTPPQI